MKKLLIIIQMLLSMQLYADYQDFRKAFYALDKQKLNEIVGYNLDLRLWEDNREGIVHGIPAIYVHGFGASPNTMNEWIRVAGPYKIPGDVITFRLADATDTTTVNFSQSSFGQGLDIGSTLVVLNAIKNCTSQWNLVGQSRGGATVVNTLATLEKDDKSSKAVFANCGISDQDLNDLRVGTKTLAAIVPMTTMHEGVMAKIKHTLGISGNNPITNSCIAAVTCLLNNFLIPLSSSGNYLPWQEQALSSIQYLPKHIKVLVHYQKNDTDVGNNNDKIFTQKLIERLGKENVSVVLGNDDGTVIDDETWNAIEDAKSKDIITRLGNRTVRAHNADPFTLLKKGVISAFYKQYGGSYQNDEKHLEQGENILNASRIDLCDIDDYFNNYS